MNEFICERIPCSSEVTMQWCLNHVEMLKLAIMRTRLTIELPFPERFSGYVVLCSRLNTTNRVLWPTLPDMVSLCLWLQRCSVMFLKVLMLKEKY